MCGRQCRKEWRYRWGAGAAAGAVVAAVVAAEAAVAEAGVVVEEGAAAVGAQASTCNRPLLNLPPLKKR